MIESLQQQQSAMPNGWNRKPPAGFEDLEERADWESLRVDLMRNVWPVYLHGPVGTGKSYSAALAFVRCSKAAKFMRFCDFVDDAVALEKSGQVIRWDGEQCNEITQASFWRVIQTVGLLVVDEIGTGWGNERRNELFWKLLEIRRGLPLILTGNIEPKGLTIQFDNRVYSRICQGQIIQVAGIDQRKIGLEDRVK